MIDPEGLLTRVQNTVPHLGTIAFTGGENPKMFICMKRHSVLDYFFAFFYFHSVTLQCAISIAGIRVRPSRAAASLDTGA